MVDLPKAFMNTTRKSFFKEFMKDLTDFPIFFIKHMSIHIRSKMIIEEIHVVAFIPSS